MSLIHERPTTLDGIVGNTDVVESIKQTLQRDNHPHCFMFQGKSGSGKSTIVKIMANMLGATELDIHEYNIADAKGIDTAREIIDLASRMPFGKATIIILDEVHKATGNFQEALLKPTEDVPDHVYYFMATTEPSKIIPTLKRRFTQYTMKYPDSTDAMLYMKRIMKLYGIELDKVVLNTVLAKSSGSVALILALMDKIQGLDKDTQLELLDDYVNEEKTVIDLCRELLYGISWKKVAIILPDVLDKFDSIRYTVLAYMNKVILDSKNKKNIKDRAVVIIEAFREPFLNPAELTATCYVLCQ